DIRTSDVPDASTHTGFNEEELFNAGSHVPTVKALAAFLLAICIFVILIYYWLEGELGFNVPLLLAPILVLVMALVRAGHAIAATRILLWGILLATMAGSYGVSGLSTPALYLLPTLTMSAFWLLSRREAVMMFAVAALNASWQAYLQTHGWIPPISERTPLYYFLAIVCVMMAALLLGNAVAKNLASQYLKIRSMNQDLLDKQERLMHEVAERKEAEAHLKQSEEQLRLVMEGSDQGFWDWDIAAGTVERNRRWAEMLGYTYEEIKHTAQQWTDFIHPDDRALAWRSINDVLEGRTASHKAEYRMLHKDGSIRWILDQAKVMGRDEHGRPTRMSGTHTDITARKLLELDSLENSLRLKRILDNLFAYVALLDTSGVVQEVNNAPLDRAGYRREDVIGKYFYDAPWWNYDPDVRAQLMEAMNAAKHGKASRYDVVVKMGDDLVPIDFQIAPVRDGSGRIVGLLPTAVDITERKHLEDELNLQAHLDYLTGLDNRRSFMEKAEVELSRTKRYESALSVLMLDIDLFKQINDAYGHQVGDLVLKTLAETFQAVLRNVDIVGRLGGEEFGVVLPETTVDEAIEVAEGLREIIAATEVALPAGLPIHFTVSIGVAAFSDQNTNLDMLLDKADKALYRAKKSGRNKVCI
ncbi:MAG TPA: hypothetical protein DCF63_16555, partial [Planctomycetaceae bacterium]|nr:hypothetical protein [Planctomycetaceae bacterium]